MIKNKKILYIAPEYFNYSRLIKNELELLGASVDLYFNQPSSNFIKLLELFQVRAYQNIKKKYFKNILTNSKNNYDYILIIRADLIPFDFLQKLKIKHPLAKFIQYIWDDVHLFPKLIESFKYFDKLLSYNSIDCKEFGLKFRPFFFVNPTYLKDTNISKNLKLFFIGSYHTDRLQVLEKVIALNPQIKINSYLYIHLITFLLCKIPLKKIPLFKFRKMKYDNMIEMIKKSAAIIDIQNISQLGLTTRIFEALGAKAKIITTNSNIKDYEFYNNNNILVIDRSTPIIEKSWLDIPYKEYDENLLNKYHIKNWIMEVFNFENI